MRLKAWKMKPMCEADVTIADAGPFRGRQLGHRLAIQPVAAVGGRVQQADQ
jgi:hypothetical protein